MSDLLPSIVVSLLPITAAILRLDTHVMIPVSCTIGFTTGSGARDNKRQIVVDVRVNFAVH